MKLIKRFFLPKNMWIPIILTLSCNNLAYFGTRFITQNKYHHDISNAFDDMIPIMAWMVVIYFACYIFWIANYIFGCQQEKEEAFRFISADFLAKVVCLICFVVYPTTNVRPEIVGTSIWDELLKFLYQIDAADNLFPSIHCLTSWFCFIAVRKNKSISIGYKIASVVMALMVCVSTLTTKQHVFIDVIGGVGLAELSYWFVNVSGFAKLYRRIVSGINSKLFASKLFNNKLFNKKEVE